MKKLFLLLALMGMVAVGCSKDDTDKGNDNKTEQPNENDGDNKEDIPENIFFGLDKESVTISPDGGSVDVVVYSNYKWEISGTSDWCTPSVKGGDANEDGQRVTFSADVAYDDREATFWFRCADEKIKFVVSQKFKETIIPDANNTFNIPAEGGVAVISYQTSVDCKVIIPEEAKDWITIAPATRGLISKSSTLYVAENTTYSARTAVVKVVAKDNAKLAVEYTINQEQKDALLADENNTFTVPSTGGEVVINYRTNVDCEVIIPDNAQSWITIAPATRGLSTYSTTLNIAENNSGKERSCVVKVTSQGDSELSAEYTIVQKTRNCIYYTSSNGEIVQPYNSSAFDATILSNTYIDGVGVIEFDAPITTIGESAFEDCSSLTSVTIPDSVTTIGDGAFFFCDSLTSVTIPDSVTSIGYSAFRGCSSLISVTIPDSVITIQDYAFDDCSSLTSVTIGDSVITIGRYAFSGCTGELIINNKIVEKDYDNSNYPFKTGWLYGSKFTSLIIGNGVTSIGDWVFYECSSLTNVTIGDSVTTIGESAFDDCSSLTSVTIGDSVTTIGVCAFWGCSSLTSITIPDSVTTIGGSAFRDCSSLTSITIPDSVTSIGYAAFAYCSSLTSVTIPDGVTTIGEYAFAYCSSLTSVTIPDSVTSIGGYAFSGCTSELIINSKIIENNYTSTPGWLYDAKFTKLTIGDSVTKIGSSAFRGCSSLTSVTIPDSVTTIGDYAFVDCSSLSSVYISDLSVWCKIDFGGSSANPLCYAKNLYLNNELVTDLVIPSDITEIKSYTFYHCDSLTSVTIGDSVATIGSYAFCGCSSLTSITIPDSVTTIGNSAFNSCDSLTSVTIGDSVTTIGEYAFAWCDSLTSVYCKATTPPAGVTSMFSGNASGRKIYVPMESVNRYKSYWSYYASAIVGYDF